MSRATATVSLDPSVLADALAEALNGKGLTATVLKNGGHRIHPCVEVSGGPAWRGAEWVYLAPEDGHWWFWWSSLELIAPIGEVATAADLIASALGGQR